MRTGDVTMKHDGLIMVSPQVRASGHVRFVGPCITVGGAVKSYPRTAKHSREFTVADASPIRAGYEEAL